jgi:hypothetical protein
MDTCHDRNRDLKQIRSSVIPILWDRFIMNLSDEKANNLKLLGDKQNNLQHELFLVRNAIVDEIVST